MSAVTMKEAREIMMRTSNQARIIVTFRAITRWSGREKNVRKLRGFDSEGRPLVYFGGWDEFVLRPREVVGLRLVE